MWSDSIRQCGHAHYSRVERYTLSFPCLSHSFKYMPHVTVPFTGVSATALLPLFNPARPSSHNHAESQRG